MRALTSVRATLWLVAVLTIAMAIATLIPQNAPREAYLKVFGTLLGPLIASTTLRNIYGSWWFIGGFLVLAVLLLACSVRRAQQLMRQEQSLPSHLTPAELAAYPQRARWRVARGREETAAGLTAALRRSGWVVSELASSEAGRSGLLARRGRWTAWGPMVVHAGMVLVLVGAGWGRLPRNTYQERPSLDAGQVFAVQVPDGSFGLRLLEARAERDREGRPSDYWAKVEVLEEGQVVRAALVRPNHPLRYHGVSVTLSNLFAAGYGVLVTKGQASGLVPVALGPDGQVDMMASVTRLEDPPWVVFIHEFRDRDEHGAERPAARVFVDKSGQVSHNWQSIGSVGAEGLDFEGVHFHLTQAGSGAQLALDRDIGVPIVFLGFLLASIGALLILGGPRRRLAALVSPRDKGAQILAGVSGAGGEQELERLSQQLESELAATREAEASRPEEIEG